MTLAMEGLPMYCGHCERDLAGNGPFAIIYMKDKIISLCHPDGGMDCYHLVTVYHHGMSCDRVSCRYSRSSMGYNATTEARSNT